MGRNMGTVMMRDREAKVMVYKLKETVMDVAGSRKPEKASVKYD